jgi:precorrin-6A/cobalt-precorrin-6A reductase
MQPGDRWQFVESLADAAAAVREQGGRVFLTTGRGGLEQFADIREAWFLIRCVEHPAVALPPRSLLLLDRGPFTIDRERALIERHRITLLVAKHSGGAATAAKLAAARERGLGVLLVRRPPPPAGVPLLRTVASARSWALGVLGAP